MAVLAIVVIFLGRIFREVSAAFSTALTTVERNSAVEVAMEQIVRDLEGMVIDSKVACRVVGNTTDTYHSSTNKNGLGFDEIWFVTSTSESGSDSVYHFVRYHVQPRILTNVGYRYQTFFLWRDTWKVELLRDKKIDPFGTDRDWWNHVYWPRGPTNMSLLLQNVVRFDIYVMGTDGKPVYTGNSGSPSLDRPRFQSLPDTVTPDNYTWYTYPVSFDIYLQATSGEVMRRAGRSLLLALERKDWDLDRKARSEMVRRSNVLVTRVRPLMARAQNLHPLPY